jgi:multisubunit Na+/H+ antiporter MnhF subunit
MMSVFQKPGAQNLSEWLHIATNELVVPAERRIWAEVTSHYEEAVEGHLQNGMPIALAQEAALAELGDAKAAGRRFRRTHLTVFEFEKVHRLLGSCQPSLWVEFGGVCLCLSFGMTLNWPRFSTSTLIGMAALFIVYETVARMLSRRKSPRRVVQMDLGGWLMVGILYLCAIFRRLPGWFHIFELLYCPIVLANILFLFRLSNKLGKMGEDWMGESVAARSEIPPNKPVAS